ncbi:MAG TPA: anthranilate phosphoribosyltransferase [Gemmatimonadaceae bacterium]|nr:anthranilate phosphoribosyltransferase [Gemmatimonadaceae bacterium]
MSTEALAHALRQLADHQSLTEDETAGAFDVIMRGDATPSQVGAMLMGLRVKGETPAEIAGAARALRAVMVRLPVDDPDALVDTCGTGGGTVTTFNISTAAALVAAGTGVRIAKHGNRSFTTRSGSADVLEALGVDIAQSVDAMRRTLESAGIVFMFAPRMHPAMKHVGHVRSELAIGTLMNMVGPLANPASAGRQVVGVSDLARLPLISGALMALGSRHALVVHGEPGMDEISPLGCTHVHEIRTGGSGTLWKIDPTTEPSVSAPNAVAELAGGSPEDNAQMIESILRGQGKTVAAMAVMLNAAAAIYVSGRAPSFGDALREADAALRDGVGFAALERLRKASRLQG